MTTTQEPDPFGAAPPPPPPAAGPSGPRAGFWQRFAAYFLDGIILWVVFLIVGYGISLALGYAVYLLGSIAYFTLLDGGPAGQTLGKKALGIRVIDFQTGGSIGYGRGFIRWIGLIVSGVVIYLGFLWMLWDKEKQGWMDKMANSVVVPVSSYPID